MAYLLDLFRRLDQQYKEVNQKIRELVQTEKYKERARILTSVPGIGVFTAMTILVELHDVERFRKRQPNALMSHSPLAIMNLPMKKLISFLLAFLIMAWSCLPLRRPI